MAFFDPIQRGLEALSKGRLDEAERHLADAEAWVRSRGLSEQALGLTVARARLAATRGERGRAEELLDEVATSASFEDHPTLKAQVASLRARLASGPERADALREALDAARTGEGEGLAAAVERHLADGASGAGGVTTDTARVARSLASAASQAQVLHTAWLAYQAGLIAEADDAVAEWLETVRDPGERVMGHLMQSAGHQLGGDVEGAWAAAEAARRDAVAGRRAELYSFAVMTLCHLADQVGDRAAQVFFAVRAWQSLDQLLGEGGGAAFQELLGRWRRAWGSEAFEAAMADAEARRADA